jgi:hypothetical protein
MMGELAHAMDFQALVLPSNQGQSQIAYEWITIATAGSSAST